MTRRAFLLVVLAAGCRAAGHVPDADPASYAPATSLAERARLNEAGRRQGYGRCLHCGDRWNWKPRHTIWYGAGQAMNLALENQLVDVGDVIKATGGTADNLRLVYKGADRSIPTSQQFVYGWYRKDLFQAKGLEAPKSWEDYLKVAKALNNPPTMYGCIVPSAEKTSAFTLPAMPSSLRWKSSIWRYERISSLPPPRRMLPRVSEKAEMS